MPLVQNLFPSGVGFASSGLRMHNPRLSMRLLPILLLALAAPLAQAAPSSAELAELFLPAEIEDPKLSPDGRFIGFRARTDDTYSIGLCDLSTGQMNLSQGDAKVRPLEFWWKTSRRVLIKTSNEKLNALGYTTFDLDHHTTEDTWELVRQPGRILDAQPEDPRHVLLVNSEEINRVDLGNGSSDTIDRFPTRVHAFVVDAQGRARAASHADFLHGEFDLWWRSVTNGDWRSHVYTAEQRRFTPRAVDADGIHLWGWDTEPGKGSTFARFDTQSGESQPVKFLQDFQPSHMLMLGRTRQPVAVAYAQGAIPHLFALSPDRQPAVDRLQKQFAGFFPVIVDALPDDKTWLVWIGNSRLPGAYFLFNQQTGETRLIAQTHPRVITEERLSSAEYFTFPSRGGPALAARLWRPKDLSSPPPLIVYCPHFLPSQPVLDLYEADVQALVAQGFAVLQVDVRGTVGFLSPAPATKEWGVVVQEDLEDAVKSLTTRKIVDPARVFLFGRGFGGVLALDVATRSSPFAAVATINVPAKISRDDLLAYTDESGVDSLATRLGGWSESARIAEELSPVQQIPNIRIPALYLHNEDSIRGRPDEDGRTIRSAVKKDANAQTGLAYSWTDRARPPSTLAAENARIYLQVGQFFQGLKLAAGK